MSTPIEYSRVVQELDTVIDDRDDALRQVAAARTQLATVRAAIQTLCEKSEQVRRSSRILPGVEPMVYVSDIRAVLVDDGAAALREQLLDAIKQALAPWLYSEWDDGAECTRAAEAVLKALGVGAGDG